MAAPPPFGQDKPRLSDNGLRRVSSIRSGKVGPSGPSKEDYDRAFDYATRAKQYDDLSEWQRARTYYNEAVTLFLDIAGVETSEKKKQLTLAHVGRMLERIKELRVLNEQEQLPSVPSAPASIGGMFDLPSVPAKKLDVGAGGKPSKPSKPSKGPNTSGPSPLAADDVSNLGGADSPAELLKNAEFHFDQALSLDQKKLSSQAAKLYKSAVDLFLQALELTKGATTMHPQLGSEGGRQALMDRCKNIMRRTGELAQMTNRTGPSRKGYLTPVEVKILMSTSRINGILCLPFEESDVVSEGFSSKRPFVDETGLLDLAPSQRQLLAGWKRPSEFYAKSKRMIDVVSPFTIKQTLVTDCSFVASLAVSAYYEQRHRTYLITSCIFPQDSKGKPVYNPSGKYMIKLTLNGIARKVVVDDRLPVDRNGNLLCSFSSNSGELWVSIIEKAFLKVMGGYNFPGSNGGIDLHILTGWIPERVGTHGDEFEKDRTWERMKSGQAFGDCLITTSTVDLTPDQEELLGLVKSHAYAVLRVEQVGSLRLLQLKNPWSRTRWKGRFSPNDAANWTPQLRSVLGYDLQQELEVDNGVFWIDYDSLLQHYGAIYLNWNPGLFKYRCTHHGLWPLNVGPKVDRYNREYCPQYALTVTVAASDKNPNVQASVWVLLSRHITEKKEEEEDYIAVHIYPFDGSGRVYYPENPLQRGTYINNPHFLCRFDAPVGTTSYKIVISQYEKLHDLPYTLNVYSTSKCVLSLLPDPYKHKKDLRGEWTAACAGGSPNHRETFFNNPKFHLRVPSSTKLLLKLMAPKDYSGNIMLFINKPGASSADLGPADLVELKVADTGPYRKGFCYCEVSAEQLLKLATTAGVTPTGASAPPAEETDGKQENQPQQQPEFPLDFTILCSTFEAGQLGHFLLTVSSSDCPVVVTPVPVASAPPQ